MYPQLDSQPADVEPIKPKTSRLAITAFVMGILSLLCFFFIWTPWVMSDLPTFLVIGILLLSCSFLMGIPAIICGIVGLVKIGKGSGQLKGKGFSIAGIVASIVVIFVFFPMLLVYWMWGISQVQKDVQGQYDEGQKNLTQFQMQLEQIQKKEE